MPPASRRKRGFALVIALGLMGFVLLLILTMTTLVQVETSVSASQKQLLKARQNALLGVQLALGQLQKEMGPDQRISATAGLLDTNPVTESIEGVEQPHWMGVWDSSSWEVGTVPPTNDLETGKPSAFRRWLVSLADHSSKTDPATPLAFNHPAEGSVKMVSGLGETAAVYAGKVLLGESSVGLEGGGYAWWVGDENLKAPLLYPEDEEASSAELAQILARTKSSGWTAPMTLAAFEEIDPTMFETSGGLSRSGFELTVRENPESESPWSQEHYHDFTPFSLGILTDVANAGFRRDLTAMFESDSLPTGFEDEPLYDNGPVWEVLQRHYLRYEAIEFSGDGMPHIDVRESQMDVNNIWDTTPERDYIIPVPFRVQYLFSIAVDPWDIYTAEDLERTADPNALPFGTPIYYLVMKPVMVLWNPLNVEMRWTMPDKRSVFYLSMGTPPIEISFNGGAVYRPLDSIFWDLGQALFVAEMEPGDDLVLKPGETTVLSLSNKNNQYNRMLIPGGDFSDEGDGTFGIYQPVWLNSRNNNMQTGWDENVVGFHSPLLRNEDADHSTEQFIPASETLNLKVRYKSHINSNTDQKVMFATHINAGSEGDPGVGDMGRLATIEFREGEPGMSQFMQEEYALGNLSSSGLSIADSGSENSFLFSISVEKKVFGDLSSGGKLGSYLDPRIPYYYTTDFSSAENVLAPIEFRYRGKSSGEALFQFDPMADRGYFGSLVEGISGVFTTEIPVSPMQSILELRHAPLGWDYGHAIFRQEAWAGRSNFQPGESGDEFAAVYNQPLGNAYPHPLIASNRLANPDRSRSVDHSYLLNSSLPEGYFFSGITSRESGPLYEETLSIPEMFDAWIAGEVDLGGGRYLFAKSSQWTLAETRDALFGDSSEYGDQFHEVIASLIAVNGMFNVNSTSVNAWRAVLAGLRDVEVPVIDPDQTAGIEAEDVAGVPAGRRSLLGGHSVAEAADGFETAVRFWNGYRTLSDSEIETLAQYIVSEVKRRGPFRTLGQFLNREVSSREAFNKTGAIQAAIDASGINASNSAIKSQVDRTELSSAELPAISYPNNPAFFGGSGEGTNGTVNQADLLMPVAPFISVRGDTFTIRAYGEATTQSDNTVKVYCEAVCVRRADYVGSGIAPTETPDPTTHRSAAQFGRKFTLVSFRWIEEDEI